MSTATPLANLSPQALAEAVGQAIGTGDLAGQALGLNLEKIAPGFAQVGMTVRPDMVNAHGTCHGGVIFTLADMAFAYACNSANHSTVAAGADIDFLAPARPGDVLTATARESAQAGRLGVYDMEVRNQEGKLIALCRGRSCRIQGSVISTPPAEHIE